MHMNGWEEAMSHELDHRGEALGTAWVHRRPARELPEQWSGPICASGPGRVGARRVIDAIRAAREIIVLSSFLLSDQELTAAILERTRRGVRAYVLLAAERVKKEPREDEDFDRRMYEEEKTLLGTLAGHALVRAGGALHAKIVLVDPPVGLGFLLTANLTKEALERNQELLLELSPEQRGEVHRWLAFAFWELAENEASAPGPLDLIGPAGWVKPPALASSVAVTAPGSTALREAALAVVERASRSLVVASFGWSEEHAVVQRIIERARKGLHVTVLARPRPAAMKALLALREAGARVLGFQYLHAKALWSDAGEALVMSANLEARGLDEGFEIGVRLEGRSAEAVGAVLAAWTEAAPMVLETGLSVGDVRGKATVWSGRSLDDVMIEEVSEPDLGRMTAASADRLEVPTPTPPTRPGRLSHRTIVHWTVEAPRLHPKARPVDTKASGGSPPVGPGGEGTATFPLYREPDGRLVVVVRAVDDIPAASAFARARGADAVVRAP